MTSPSLLNLADFFSNMVRSNVLIRTSLTDHSLESSRFWWRDARLVRGVAFKKTFTYAGAEQQPKSFKSLFILCLNVELELKAEKDNAECVLSRCQSIKRS